MVQLRLKVSIEEMFTKKRSVLKKKKTLGSQCQREHVALQTSGGQRSFVNFEATASSALPRNAAGVRAPERDGARTRKACLRLAPAQGYPGSVAQGCLRLGRRAQGPHTCYPRGVPTP